MSRDKQIEEMAKDIQLNMQILPNPKEHPSHQLARLLVQDGYRKASDLAEEIFAEIEECFFEELVGCTEAKLIDEERFAELKKKYTKSEKDNG